MNLEQDVASSGRTQTGRPARRRLSADDWATAALTAIGEGGLAALAVEPLAVRLGTTKGSFYWHFSNRQALIEAALRLWEEGHTEAIIAALDSEPDAEARLRKLFALVVGASRGDMIEVALLASADDPLVAPVMRRVTERRVQYVASQYEELGLVQAEARSWALLAVGVYLGHLQFAHAASGVLPAEPETWQQHLDQMLTVLVPQR